MLSSLAHELDNNKLSKETLFYKTFSIVNIFAPLKRQKIIQHSRFIANI